MLNSIPRYTNVSPPGPVYRIAPGAVVVYLIFIPYVLASYIQLISVGSSLTMNLLTISRTRHQTLLSPLSLAACYALYTTIMRANLITTNNLGVYTNGLYHSFPSLLIPNTTNPLINALV